MLQQRGRRQEQRDPLRFLWVLLIIVAALAAIYFYVIPFLASSGSSGSSSDFLSGVCLPYLPGRYAWLVESL